MDVDLIVVDGPNTFNRVEEHLRNCAGQPAARRYLQEWFDIDRVLAASVGIHSPPLLGYVVFHSDRALGGKGGVRLTGSNEILPFWARQGTNPFSSTELVRLTKDPATGEGKESGVDMSIATFLFETADRWRSVCIVSDDSDFEPVVRHMKRRGKQVFSVVSPRSKSALVQVCTSHFRLNVDFVANDFRCFDFVCSGGVLDREQQRVVALSKSASVSFKTSTSELDAWELTDVEADSEQLSTLFLKRIDPSIHRLHPSGGAYLFVERSPGGGQSSSVAIGPRLHRRGATVSLLADGVHRHFGDSTANASWKPLMSAILPFDRLD